MKLWYRYRVSDGQFLNGMPTRPAIGAGEGLQQFAVEERPDLRTDRYDGSSVTKKRAATTQELAAYDAARLDMEALGRFDTKEAKMLKALAVWTAQKLNIPLAQAKSEILTIYKGLP